jgi:LysM repeat protein
MSQYKVKEGDTLWKIAEKLLGNGSRYSEIQRANNLTSDVIHSGQVLKIPGRGHNTTSHGATSHGAASHGTTSRGATSHDITSISVCSKA